MFCDFKTLRNSNLNIRIWWFIGTHSCVLTFYRCFYATWQNCVDTKTAWPSKFSQKNLRLFLLRILHVRGHPLPADLLPLALSSPPTSHFSSPVILSKLSQSPKSRAHVLYIWFCVLLKNNNNFFSLGLKFPHLKTGNNIIIIFIA